MAGFRKAEPKQAALKVGFYGPPGSGKSFTALLCAEGLAKRTGKRIAFVDTERGTDFYSQDVPQRRLHPAAFDFDALYTRSITETLAAVKGIDTNTYCVIVLDSMTHLWEACINSYNGPRHGKQEAIPFTAWSRIKKPYKELMQFLLNSPLHVFICGRQGNEYEIDDETKQTKAVGYKMKAEGETPYEPHILIRLEAEKSQRSNEPATHYGWVDKDRTGVLMGRTIEGPNFESICLPLLALLGHTQAGVEGQENHDAETLARQQAELQQSSSKILRAMSARIELAETAEDLAAVGKDITPQVKARMLPEDLATLREAYVERENVVGKPGKGAAAADARPADDPASPQPEPTPPAAKDIGVCKKKIPKEPSVFVTATLPDPATIKDGDLLLDAGRVLQFERKEFRAPSNPDAAVDRFREIAERTITQHCIDEKMPREHALTWAQATAQRETAIDKLADLTIGELATILHTLHAS